MTLELYHAPYSTCSQKVRLVLAEKGLRYASHLVNLGAHEHLTPEYLRLNPNGVVPTLVHDGRPVCDSSVIAEYLDEVFPDPPLCASTAYDRARMRAWMRYFEEVATPAVRVPSFNAFFVKQIAPGNPEFQHFTAKLPLRKHFYREMGADGFSPEKVSAALERLQSTFERVNRALATEGEYLLGNYSLVDTVLTPTVIRMIDLGAQKMWGELPHLASWVTRIQRRASFKEAYFVGSRLGTGVAPSSGETPH
jgi:glutathione S-transferase